MDRFVFDNLVYKFSKDKFLLMNLINFRREFVTESVLLRLSSISCKYRNNVPLTREDLCFLEPFYVKKQIFTKEFASEIDAQIAAHSQTAISCLPIRSITINLTHKCNFACTYCYQKNYKAEPNFSRTMTVDDINKIAEYIRLPFFDSSALDEIVISGGEPLLASNISTIKHILNSFPFSRKVIFTNGVNILRFKNDIPFELIDEYQISLDGTDEVIRTINKSTDNFEEILSGISYLASLGKKISIVTMWTIELEKNLDQFLNEIKMRGLFEVENIKFKFVLPQNFYSTNPLDDNYLNWEHLAYVIKRYNPILHKFGSNLDLYPEAMSLSAAIHRGSNSRHNLKYKKCDLATSLPVVFAPDGFVYWCMCLGSSYGTIGNYRTQEFFLDRVNHLGNRTVFTIEKCSRCSLRYLCGGGCVLPLTSAQDNCHVPSCGVFASDYFWQHLEDFI